MKKQLSLKNKRAIAGYGFIAPFIVGMLLIFGPSIIKALVFLKKISNIGIMLMTSC